MNFINPTTGEVCEIDVSELIEQTPVLSSADYAKLWNHYEDVCAADSGQVCRQRTHDALMVVLKELGYSVYNKHDAKNYPKGC
jgi:hypothetical protein